MHEIDLSKYNLRTDLIIEKVNDDANISRYEKANVKVEKVNTLNYDGKFKVQGRAQGYTSKFKKAYVTLSKDSKSIEFFDSLS